MAESSIMGFRCSVVIPTADRGVLLERSIRSVLEQTVPAAEIIVVDNGNEPAVLDSRLREAVILLRTPPRIGPGRSRNVGAGHAQFELVAFLDDDDIWQPDYLEQSLAIFQATSADVVVGRLDRQGLDGRTSPYKLFPAELQGQRGVYYKNPGFGGQNFMIRRDLFLQLDGFDERLPASEDRDLAARLLQAGAVITPAPLSIAVLCDHDGDRVRSSLVVGNKLFIKKHWRHMKPVELVRAVSTYTRRHARLHWFGRTQ